MVKIDRLVRSRRKTVAIIVEHSGDLVVRAPLRTSKAQIEEFVAHKAKWIARKQAQARKQQDQWQPHRYEDGEPFYYLGKTYPLALVERRRPPLALDLTGNFTLDRARQAEGEQIFTAWYREQARILLAERVEEYAGRGGLGKPVGLRITGARTRWGSCGSKGRINFTLRLVMTPLPMIDYVAVHELAHLKELNHSKAFWALVKGVLPDYKSRDRWLKDNGRLFRL